MVLLRRRLRPRMERGLEAPESDRVSHSCFDEFGQRFARLEHGLKFSSQLWLDADLGYDGGLHARSVLRVGYAQRASRALRLCRFNMKADVSCRPQPGGQKCQLPLSHRLGRPSVGARLLLTRSLELQGHKVATAGNGRIALGLLRADAFDLMLLDMEMPEPDCFGVLEPLAAEGDALCDLPVIVTSSLEGVANVVRCLELGADD